MSVPVLNWLLSVQKKACLHPPRREEKNNHPTPVKGGKNQWHEHNSHPWRQGPYPHHCWHPSNKSADPLDSTFRAMPFPEVTALFCRLPLPTFFHLTRGFKPRRPAAVMSTTWPENHHFPCIFKGWPLRTGHPGRWGALPAIQPYLSVTLFQGCQPPFEPPPTIPPRRERQ